ncbi:MAG: type II toxin-antitoxin system RelE/ParE family toxin [Spirochaetaceae bacterium]|nr:MAG: type II toxin-antitoxin system RelE/ParE family toxin [Spirochaetaceae bacterium]
MPNIAWSSNAAADFEDIVGWILDDHSARHAESFVDSIDTEIRQLEGQPRSGRVIPELERQNITKYREVVVSPWRVFYSVEAERILILAVIDGRRNIEDILLRRNLR